MIEVGIMVRIIDHPNMSKWGKALVGHVGKVLRRFDNHPRCGARWEVEGANPEFLAFPEESLRPIDDRASWDADIWQQIGWKPNFHKQHANK